MKRFIKIIVASILSVVLLIGFIIAITIHPELLLRNEIRYENYVVRSTNSIDQNIIEILKKVDNQIKKCEIYQDSQEHRIFFYNGNKFFMFIHEKIFRVPTHTLMYNHGNSKIQNITTFRQIKVKSNKIFDNRNKEYFLSHTLTHEIIHSFQNRLHGDPRKYPFWKMEGFSEYCADLNNDKTTHNDIALNIELLKKQDLSWLKNKEGEFVNFNFEQFDKSFFSDEKGKEYSGIYFTSYVMVQYLFKVKEIDYNTFMSSEIKQNKTLFEMFKWFETYKNI
jgi:hypothetical protein